MSKILISTLIIVLTLAATGIIGCSSSEDQGKVERQKRLEEWSRKNAEDLKKTNERMDRRQRGEPDNTKYTHVRSPWGDDEQKTPEMQKEQDNKTGGE